MALSHSPKITTDGLILCLDAANVKSYPGSGTTWTDVKSGYNSSLYNGPTFTNNGKGAFSFDGSNDYAEIPVRDTNLEFQPTQPFSVFCWLYNLAAFSSLQGTIVSNMVGTNPYPGWDLWKTNATTLSAHLISSWSANAIKVSINFNFASYSNQWVNLGYTYNGSCPTNATNSLNSIDFYVNGVLTDSGKSNSDGTDGFNTASEVISYNASQRFRISSRWQSGSIQSGSVITLSNVQLYNKKLSVAEIQQNFNTYRGRYGI